MTRTFIVLVAVVMLFARCSDTPDGKFNVTVSYKNADNPALVGQSIAGAMPVSRVSKAFLYEVPFGSTNPPVKLDSSDVTGKEGKLELEGTGTANGLYELEFNNGHIILVTNDAKDIKIEIDFSKKDNYYTVSGSEASMQMKDFMVKYTDHSIRVNRAFAEMDSLKQFNASDSVILAATDQKNDRVRALNDYLKKFIGETTHPAVGIFALGWASRSFSKQEFDAVLAAMVKKFPQHKPMQELKENYDARQAQLAEMEKRRKEENSWTGKVAPEIEMPDVDGKKVKLSSFRGKYVLVDFWASWCRPCRDENPNIVQAYNRFKDKNFTIVGVSLDKTREDWVKAIEEDKLAWTHISDLQFWNSKSVELYKFNGIPYNVLIDPEGKVVAEGLRGADLERKLEELLK